MIAACVIAAGTGSDPSPGPPPYGAPVADFIPPDGIFLPPNSNINFTDLSTNSPTTWEWFVNNSLASQAQAFSYYFGTIGTFQVKLRVTNAYGDDEVTNLYYVGIPPP